jgi:uncharacterized protein YlxP (DUF503 family)
MVVGVLRLEFHLADSHSLKEKRAVLKSLKDRLRGKFNVAVAEVDMHELWQRACLGVAALGGDRHYVSGLLHDVVEWVRMERLAALIRADEEYY